MATAAQQASRPVPEWVDRALQAPKGARFFRCALQVNPFDYLVRHSTPSAYESEDSYNGAIVEAALENRVEVIGVTDHYRVKSGSSLIAAAEQAGIKVFPGFEAVTKEGVHFLCLFPVGTPLDRVDRAIGACGVQEESTPSPLGSHDSRELLALAKEWDAVCVAAHVAGKGGLLRELSGQARIEVWRDQLLTAASLPGPVSDAPTDLRPILENRDPNYFREPSVAVINAKDVSAPDQLALASHSTWIKMSSPSLDGLRQAFLDHESRVRLGTELEPLPRTQIRAIRWDSGFLDECELHLNEDLNVLVGPPGAGKSTVVESLRYALRLEPVGDDAKAAHRGIVQKVLQSGTRVSVVLHSHRPSPDDYLVERTVPNPPSVRQLKSGEVLDVDPAELVPGMQVFGQHEISEVARSPEKRTSLLNRFVHRDPALEGRKASVQRELERSRERLLETERERLGIRERLAALPGLEETLRRFREAGVEERLSERSLLVREERTIKTADERVEPFRSLLSDLRSELPVDRAFVAPKALSELPGREALAALEAVLAELSREVEASAGELSRAIERAQRGMDAVRDAWGKRRDEVEAEYAQVLRELQKTQVDGAEFIELRRRIEDLRPLRERIAGLEETAQAIGTRRRELLLEWEDLKAEEFRALLQAAKRVSKELRPRVRVEVAAGGEREPLLALLRDRVSGRLGEACQALERQETLSLTELAEAWRAGANDLRHRFAIPEAQAQRLVDAGPALVMEIEELELPPTAEVELNVSRESEPERWERLRDLSTGQRATAILLLLLLESDAPLVVDQPEDDLDNRFIFEGVVPRMRDEKQRRQFIFSTHNANIPVLGDAELIVGLTAAGEPGDRGHAEMPSDQRGSIDLPSVRALVEEQLEGGHEAFELRRRKYRF